MQIVSDFDGTIVDTDLVEYLLDQYGGGDWRRFDDLYERGEISLEECLRQQYVMIREPRQKLLDAVDRVATFRAGLDDLLDFSAKKGISFTIASAGLDFVIGHLLRQKKVRNQIRVLAPRSKPTSRGIVLDFSRLPMGDSSNFKCNIVRSITAEGSEVAYIGDGISDLDGIKAANVRFAIKGSRLAERCGRDGITCHQVVSLKEVAGYLTSRREHGLRDVDAEGD